MTRQASRLQALEQRQVATGPESAFPGYICAANEAEAITKLAALGNMVKGAVKLYIGIDIDEMWDTDNETEEQAREA